MSIRDRVLLHLSSVLTADTYSSTTFDVQRRPLNVPYLLKSGAIFVTYPHDAPLAKKNASGDVIEILDPDFDNEPGRQQASFQNEQGWIVLPDYKALPENRNLFSLISLFNVKQGGWAAEAATYRKKSAYGLACDAINSSKPNLGQSELVYDGKYNQILWSAKKLRIPSKKVYL